LRRKHEALGNIDINHNGHSRFSDSYYFCHRFPYLGGDRDVKEYNMSKLKLLELKVKAESLRNAIKKLKDDLKSYDRQIKKIENGD